MLKAEVICDSTYSGSRLTTFVLTYPRYIHSELMTHRMFSRNASSSRAIPIEKAIEKVLNEPVMPSFVRNQKGMQGGEDLIGFELAHAKALWLLASTNAIDVARTLSELGVHKQVVNRLLEPFSWITTIVSATNYANFFYQRLMLDPAGKPFAQQEMYALAQAMRYAYDASTPTKFSLGDWHLPFIRPEEDLDLEIAKKVSVSRCARVSYLNHEGTYNLQKDIKLFNDLVTHRHWSPLEHVAMACKGRWGNFDDWRQYRKGFLEEMVW